MDDDFNTPKALATIYEFIKEINKSLDSKKEILMKARDILIELLQVLGPTYTSRLYSAERLAVGWLERRMPEELEVYPHIVAIAHHIIAEAFSRKVITPGVTTTQDVSWWIRERFRELRLSTWFHPSVS